MWSKWISFQGAGHEYVLREALERREKFFVAMGDSGEQICRPAVKLSR